MALPFNIGKKLTGLWKAHEAAMAQDNYSVVRVSSDPLHDLNLTMRMIAESPPSFACSINPNREKLRIYYGNGSVIWFMPMDERKPAEPAWLLDIEDKMRDFIHMLEWPEV
jgi:hypothetical protein